MEPNTTVPTTLAVANGTVLYVADVQALRTFAGRYEQCKTNGVVLISIARHTIAQHTVCKLKGGPKVESQTLEQVVTNRGEWSGDESDSSRAGAAGGAAAAAGDDASAVFEAYAQAALGATCNVDALVAAHETKLKDLFVDLRAGPGQDDSNPLPAFIAARDALTSALTIVVTTAVQRRSNEDEQGEGGGGGDTDWAVSDE